MKNNWHKIVTWLLVIALIGTVSYALSLVHWTLGTIFALLTALVILYKIPANDK